MSKRVVAGQHRSVADAAAKMRNPGMGKKVAVSGDLAGLDLQWCSQSVEPDPIKARPR